MNISVHLDAYLKLSFKRNLAGTEALEAVKQDGYALQYVKEQTEAIALEAVKQDGDALRYVDAALFGDIAETEKISEV